MQQFLARLVVSVMTSVLATTIILSIERFGGGGAAVLFKGQ